MSRAIHVTGGNHAGPKSERGLEPYYTPACAVEALLRVENLPLCLWDPCAGGNAIVKVLTAEGHLVSASDIAIDGQDFLKQRRAPGHAEAIVMNPPFSQAGAFVLHGLALVRQVIILQRLQFLESQARAELFDTGTLRRIWVFRNRVPRMHREGWTGKKAAPAMALAWYVFDRHYNGKPTLDWIRAERSR